MTETRISWTTCSFLQRGTVMGWWWWRELSHPAICIVRGTSRVLTNPRSHGFIKILLRQQMVLNDDDGGAKDWELFSPGRPRYHLSACLHAGVSIDWLTLEKLIDLHFCRIVWFALHAHVELIDWLLALIDQLTWWRKTKYGSHRILLTPTRIISWPCHWSG